MTLSIPGFGFTVPLDMNPSFGGSTDSLNKLVAELTTEKSDPALVKTEKKRSGSIGRIFSRPRKAFCHSGQP